MVNDIAKFPWLHSDSNVTGEQNYEGVPSSEVNSQTPTNKILSYK